MGRRQVFGHHDLQTVKVILNVAIHLRFWKQSGQNQLHVYMFLGTGHGFALGSTPYNVVCP